MSLFRSLFSVFSSKFVLLFVSMLVMPGASAESVTLKMYCPDNTYTLTPIDRVNDVSAVFADADASKYFESVVSFEHLSYIIIEGKSIVFGGSETKEPYSTGKLKLKLTPWFKTKIINTVAVDAEYYDYDYNKVYGVYLYANGQRSDLFVSMAKDEYNHRTLTSEIGSACDELELQFAGSSITLNTFDKRVAVYSLTIEYEEGGAEPIAVSPAEGLENLPVGQSVTLANCVIDKEEDGYVARVVKTAGGRPVNDGAQPETYKIAVTSATSPETGVFLDITGRIVENAGIKSIEIESTTPRETIFTHNPPEIYVNGAPLEDKTINADDCIELRHEYGDNVIICYTKRRGATLDPATATHDPARIQIESSSDFTTATTPEAGATSAATDESGTYIYTGPFRLVHADNLGSTSGQDVKLSLRVYSAPTLTAGASWAPSELITIGNEITTGALDTLIDGESGAVSYYDLQGRPEPRPEKGQLLIRRQGSSAETVIY